MVFVDCREGYPLLIEHRVEHESLLQRAIEMEQAVRSGKISDGPGLLSFLLKKWLLDHIPIVDKAKSSWLRQNGFPEQSAPSPAMGCNQPPRLPGSNPR